MPLPGYKRLSYGRYETPAGNTITRYQYQKIQHGGISGRQYAKIRQETGQQSNYQYWLHEYMQNEGYDKHNGSVKRAMQDPVFKAAYKALSKPYQKKDTMPEWKWKRYGVKRWRKTIKALETIYGPDDLRLSGDRISKYMSPEQE